MNIELPDVHDVVNKIVDIESTFDGKTQPIYSWVDEQRREIHKNQNLLKEKSAKSDIAILHIFLTNVLVRAMSGEAGQKVFNELKQAIKTKSDLNEENYQSVLKRANYRWGEQTGSKVISQIVQYFGDKLNWNWQSYFSAAHGSRQTNFINDELLKIKHIGLKLRDLALSNFSSHYAAFDLHVTRVATRIGLLNYGFDLLHENDIEMGNNPTNIKNYLFLHRLFIKLSQLTGEEFSVVDFDRIFWHFGKTICGAKPKCKKCPINSNCLTGKYRLSN